MTQRDLCHVPHPTHPKRYSTPFHSVNENLFSMTGKPHFRLFWFCWQSTSPAGVFILLHDSTDSQAIKITSVPPGLTFALPLVASLILLSVDEPCRSIHTAARFYSQSNEESNSQAEVQGIPRYYPTSSLKLLVWFKNYPRYQVTSFRKLLFWFKNYYLIGNERTWKEDAIQRMRQQPPIPPERIYCSQILSIAISIGWWSP